MSIWQTKPWQEMLEKSWQIEKIINLRLSESEEIYVEKRKIWLWEFWLFVLWIDFYNLDEKKFEKIKKLCKNEKALFIQLENLDYSPFYYKEYFKNDLSLDKKNFYSLKTKDFKKWYWKKFITPYTALIDLNKNLDEILAEMKPKWRYNIRLAEKKWVKVEEVEKTEKNIKIFYDLMKQTTYRDWFSGNNLDYYKIFLKNIFKSKLLFSEFEGKIIAAWIFTYEKKQAIYYYWASTSDKKYRNLMAPYLLQWEAIKIGKNLNCEIYDFLWTAWEEEINSPLAWVTDFKLKFTQKSVKVSESLIFVNKKIKYFFMQILRKLKK